MYTHHRPNPIVQIGISLPQELIPLAFMAYLPLKSSQCEQTSFETTREKSGISIEFGLRLVFYLLYSAAWPSEYQTNTRHFNHRAQRTRSLSVTTSLKHLPKTTEHLPYPPKESGASQTLKRSNRTASTRPMSTEATFLIMHNPYSYPKECAHDCLDYYSPQYAA